jgi:hypothetical protein
VKEKLRRLAVLLANKLVMKSPGIKKQRQITLIIESLDKIKEKGFIAIEDGLLIIEKPIKEIYFEDNYRNLKVDEYTIKIRESKPIIYWKDEAECEVIFSKSNKNRYQEVRLSLELPFSRTELFTMNR